ncbi:MAG: hypothetical protein R2751_10855 [Bacteroidales bacterium]
MFLAHEGDDPVPVEILGSILVGELIQVVVDGFVVARIFPFQRLEVPGEGVGVSAGDDRIAVLVEQGRILQQAPYQIHGPFRGQGPEAAQVGSHQDDRFGRRGFVLADFKQVHRPVSGRFGQLHQLHPARMLTGPLSGPGSDLVGGHVLLLRKQGGRKQGKSKKEESPRNGEHPPRQAGEGHTSDHDEKRLGSDQSPR